MRNSYEDCEHPRAARIGRVIDSAFDCLLFQSLIMLPITVFSKNARNNGEFLILMTVSVALVYGIIKSREFYQL